MSPGYLNKYIVVPSKTSRGFWFGNGVGQYVFGTWLHSHWVKIIQNCDVWRHNSSPRILETDLFLTILDHLISICDHNGCLQFRSHPLSILGGNVQWATGTGWATSQLQPSLTFSRRSIITYSNPSLILLFTMFVHVVAHRVPVSRWSFPLTLNMPKLQICTT